MYIETFISTNVYGTAILLGLYRADPDDNDEHFGMMTKLMEVLLTLR